MSRVLRRSAGAALAVAATLALVGLSRVPDPGEVNEAVLRMSWRIRGEQVEQNCRRPTAEELAKLPSHMRNPEACVGKLEPYHLTVRVNGETRLDERVEGAGARGDRPIYVFQDLSLEPGTHRIQVSFRREEGSSESSLGLHLDETVTLAPGQVALASLNDAGGALRLRGLD